MSVAFCVPAHGRLALAAVCFRQLRRTCDALIRVGVDAFAAVAADDENLELARSNGFIAIEHPNQPLGAKWNALYAACAAEGAEYLIPLGSDDWIGPAFVMAQLQADGEMRCTRRSAIVSEDGRRLARLRIPYDGGDGVRMMPAALLAPFGYRPCDDNATRAIDTTTLRSVSAYLGRPPRISYVDSHPLAIVDFKSSEGQLNGYQDCLAFLDGPELDPWEALAEHYPADALTEMRALYGAGEPRPPIWPPPSSPPPLPPRAGAVASISVDREMFTYPASLLEECSSALLLFCSGRMGSADGFHVAKAGLTDVTCVDWDAATLDVYRETYPAAWRYVQADVFEWVDGLDQQWDLVSADAPSQYAELIGEMLPRYCALARKYVVATVMGSELEKPRQAADYPAGWFFRENIHRTTWQGKDYFWVVFEKRDA